MGDRTYVTLTVLLEHVEQARDILVERNGEPHDEGTTGKTPELGFFSFEEVNYGNLCGRDQLQALGIAYTSEWENGGNFRAGGEYCRFTAEGDTIIKEIYQGDEDPPIAALLQRLDDYTKLKAFILDYQEKTTPLPWDNQLQYGKLHRTKLLISKEAP